MSDERVCFVGAVSESLSTKAYMVDVQGVCARREGGESKWRTAVPPIAEPAGLPHCCPAQGLTCTAEGSSLHQINLFGELPEVLHWQGSRCPGAGHWSEASSFPLPRGAR